MENKAHAMAAGTFVLVLTLLLTGLWLWLTRDQHSYSEYELSTGDAISGLQEQATVRYKGVAVGKVVNIGFDPQIVGNVLIRIQVEDDAPISDTGTYGVLGYQGVTGIAHIQLDDSKDPMVALPRGAGGIPRLPMKSSPLTVLADQGLTILAKVDDATQRINQLLDEDNQKRFRTLLDNLAAAAGNVNELSKTVNVTVRDKIAPAVEQFPAMADDARRSLQALEQAAQQTSSLVGEVKNLTQSAQAPGGPLDNITQGTQSIARAAQRFDNTTLPVLGQAAADVSTAARQIGATVSSIGNNPQSLIYGDGRENPGPGEPGFVAPSPAR